MKERIEKITLTVIMVLWYLLMPAIGYENGDTRDLPAHVFYMVSHANIWHLAGNLFVLWLLRGRLYLLPSVLVAFFASYLPSWSLYGEVGATMGFSGVLFAIIGIMWGVASRHDTYGRRNMKDFTMKALPFALIGMALPNVNWCIHFYTIMAGFVYGRYVRE